ncbi:MAG: hypothetical protein H6744_04520 [Deltaproteobacteria bacterium]|nr:hypothetical protein [Deltaproteobacteria bacterium]MCB9785939.1 hypothetical protein [Deltaproteobacteria bacterium]
MRVAAVALAVALLGSSPAASAGRHDVALSGFGSFDADGKLVVDEAGFERMARDLGLAMRPRFGGPASTVGSLGFDVGYSLVLTDIDERKSYWTHAVPDPDKTLKVSQISLRKGLPYSLEVGGVLGHLHGSSLWSFAFELKWAFVEGLDHAPDIGIRLHVNTVVGSRDLAMLTTGGDFLVGKTFGLGGMVQLKPYIGYAGTYIRATSHVIGVFRTGGLQPTTFILPDQNIGTHRALLGLRLLATVVDLGFEAALGKGTQTYAFRAGLNF